MSHNSEFNAPMASQVQKKPPQKSGVGGKAIASLILGLLSVVLMCFTAVPGLILGIMGLSDANKGLTEGKGISIAGIVLSSLGLLWTVLAILVLLLLPALQSVRSAARQNVSTNNIRQQALGMLNYESGHMRFPLRDRNGLSWRVAILPYIGESQLYDQFHHDEPWDSQHNLQLLTEMPAVFDCPTVMTEPGFTVYQVPYTDFKNSGGTPAFSDDGDAKGIRIGSISDGLSNTIMVLEVDPDAAVEWTRPADWKYDPADPMRDLGDVTSGTILIGLADGSTREVPIGTPRETFKAIVTRSGGEDVDFDF